MTARCRPVVSSRGGGLDIAACPATFHAAFKAIRSLFAKQAAVFSAT